MTASDTRCVAVLRGWLCDVTGTDEAILAATHGTPLQFRAALQVVVDDLSRAVRAALPKWLSWLVK